MNKWLYYSLYTVIALNLILNLFQDVIPWAETLWMISTAVWAANCQITERMHNRTLGLLRNPKNSTES